MGALAAVGGFLLGPIAGSIAGNLAAAVIKPKDVSNYLLIGAVAHAGGSFAYHHFAGGTRDDTWHSFHRGAMWGEGVSAALMGSSGLYLRTDSGRQMWLRTLGADSSKQLPVFTATTRTATMGAERSSFRVPGGLLGLLMVARKQGY
jgi:hypothetical protein